MTIQKRFWRHETPVTGTGRNNGGLAEKRSIPRGDVLVNT